MGWSAFAAPSSLRNEDLDEILVMDWWPDCDMSERQGTEYPATTGPVTRREMERFKDTVQDALQRAGLSLIPAPGVQVAPAISDTTATPFWKHPVFLVVLSAFLGVAGKSLVDHVKEDKKTGLTSEVATQLAPINQGIQRQIQQLSRDFSGFGERLAALEVKAQDAWELKLHGLSDMPPAQLQKNLRTVKAVFEEGRQQGKVAPLAVVDAIANKLSTVPEQGRDYWRAAAAAINYTSFVRENVQPPAPARQFANELLVRNVGPKPNFIATVG